MVVKHPRDTDIFGSAGRGEGVVQNGCGLACFCVSQGPKECRGFIAPTSADPNPEEDTPTSPIPAESWVKLELCLCIALPAYVGDRFA